MTTDDLAQLERFQHTDGGKAEHDWIEAARKAFLFRWYEENGDDYENSTNVYGDTA